MIPRLQDTSQAVPVQDTTFSVDVMGRYVCSTWDEAVNNGGVAFDAVVIGSGMFGAYCAEKIYRNSGLRVLVLEAGSCLVSEHVQNLARIGLNPAGAVVIATNRQDPGTRDLVWGSPWRSHVAFPGLAYCLGGRSLYWGGWSPRLTPSDLVNWPAAIAGALQGPPKSHDEYERIERETGVFDTTDYISGALNEALKKRLEAVRTGVPTVDGIEDAPLAIQAAPPASGLFSFDKYSSAPILIDAIREDTANPDWRRRLFLVPRTHVVRLIVTNGAVTRIDAFERGQPKSLAISRVCAVVLACGTIESTRLGLESFPTLLIGRNLMAHLRSNTVVRVKRSAVATNLPVNLEAAALLVRGSTPQGHYHLQVTAAAVKGPNSEADMFRMIPDIDLLDQTLASQDADWVVVTFRGIGEMRGSQDPTVPKQTDSAPSWVDLSPDQLDEFGMRRAWVNLVPTAEAMQLWRTMDDAALTLAQALAGAPANIQYFYNNAGSLNAPGAAWHPEPPPPSTTSNRNDPANKVRDGVGTTHHEAGTLWLGSDPATAVTDLNGRFHHVANAYVAGPALFPALGSANPSLTGLALARRTAFAITTKSLSAEPGFRPLGTGGLMGWQMAGFGGFIELGANIIESVDGIGLLWYTREEFADFILRLDWRASNFDDNSGVFLRFPALGSDEPAKDWQLAVTQGYEIQIDDTGKNPDTNPVTFGDPLHQTGAVYTLAASSRIASRPVGQWNTFDIQAKGSSITVTLNGEVVTNLKKGTRPFKGHIGLQNHHPGSRVQFRNIRIKTL